MVLMVGMFLFPKCQNLAAKDALEMSLENSTFYNIAVNQGILIVDEKEK